MEIQIDEGAIMEAVRTMAAEGIAKGVGSWEIQQQVAAVARKVTLESAIVEAVGVAVGERLTGGSDALAQQIADAVAPAIIESLRSAFIEAAARVVIAVRLDGTYSTTEERHKALAEAVVALRSRLVGG